jgi:hypothetical protein
LIRILFGMDCLLSRIVLLTNALLSVPTPLPSSRRSLTG